MQRSTKQRRAIREALRTCGRPLSPKEIVAYAAEQNEILSLTTVYRCVKILLERGELAAVEVPGQPARYEASGLDHHHHFHCDGCDRLFDIPGCPDDLHSMAPTGFVPTHHELILRGQCPACA